MAGAGAKLFTSGSVLTADQVNTFLMDQSIMRFASTTARDAAFGGAGEPTLAEGMFAYTTDTNTLWLYDGAAWVSAVNAASLNGVGTFTSYTPVLTASTTNPTLGAGSVSAGSYTRIKDLIIYRFSINVGGAGFNAGSGGYLVSLPVTATVFGSFTTFAEGTTMYYDSSATTNYIANAWLVSTTNLALLYQSAFNGQIVQITNTAPVTPAQNDIFSGLIVYRAA